MAATSANQRKKYEQYKQNHVREKNKILKIHRHLRRHPTDKKSEGEIIRLEAIIGRK